MLMSGDLYCKRTQLFTPLRPFAITESHSKPHEAYQTLKKYCRITVVFLSPNTESCMQTLSSHTFLATTHIPPPSPPELPIATQLPSVSAGKCFRKFNFIPDYADLIISSYVSANLLLDVVHTLLSNIQ